MKLCYQVATPDITRSPAVTAFQGSLEESFDALSSLGYDGVEFMTGKPEQLDTAEILRLCERKNLEVVLVCTGEIYGQLGMSFTDPDENVRRATVDRVCDIIDFAGKLGAKINIGRVHGHYHDALGIPRAVSYAQAIDAFRRISEFAGKRDVRIALENVTLMQTDFCNTVAECVAVVKDVDNEYFRIMMDVFHMNIEEKDMFDPIRQWCGYNIHVHLADNNRRYPGHCGLDFRKILQAFRDAGYDDAFCTEIFQIPDQFGAAKGAIEHLAPLARDIYGRAIK